MRIATRDLVGRYLIEHGQVEEASGRVTSILSPAIGRPTWGISTALRSMETDGEIERSANRTKCFRVSLTEQGRSRYRPEVSVSELSGPEVSVSPADVASILLVGDPQGTADLCRELQSSIAEHLNFEADSLVLDLGGEPVKPGVIVDYETLVTTVRDLLLSERPDQDIEDLKVRLARSLEDANALRRKNSVLQDQVHRLERDLGVARNRLKLKDAPRAKKVELDEMLKVVKSTPGYEVDRLSTGHIRVTKLSTGQSVSVAGTPSDYRGTKNARADLRRLGVNV